VTLQNCNRFFEEGTILQSLIVQLRNTKLEDELIRKGGGNITVLAFYVTWSRALARASIGGVERQNPSIRMN
jgi:hypothetical protein